jgi:hypothetical protein
MAEADVFAMEYFIKICGFTEKGKIPEDASPGHRKSGK